jgi:hypothetical protein
MTYEVKRFTDVSDEHVIEMFCRMDQEGTKRQVFYDGLIETPWDFLEYVRSGLVFGGFIYKDGKPAACIWVSEISGNVAFFHYWTFKICWGNANEVALVALEYLAKNTHLTGLCGRTPAHLKLAIRALKRRGFRVLGTIPEAVKLYDGGLEDALVSFYDLKPLKGE